MKQLTSKHAAELLTAVIPLIMPEDRVLSLITRLSSQKPDDPEIKKHSIDVDSALIAISLAETEEKMKAILQGLSDDVFLALLLRWHRGVEELIKASDLPSFFIPDHVKNITGTIIRLALVKDQTKIGDVYSVH